ncbi:hypothetical protein ACET3X_001397 [Alternaria dauci]|uniref:Uncharacterized protein n=1 Tax=Alternaria dauci TaxID=48095 RepID=A0ABR3UXN4_9PLEO
MHHRSYLLTSATIAVFAAATLSAECTREGLLAAANSYLAAQAAGKPSTLSLTSTNFTYLQNNSATDIATGLLSVPFVIDFNRSTADTAACASYTMWISTSASEPHVVGTQIRHADNDTSIISSIDTVAATTGDLFFDAAKTLSYIRAETWATLPVLLQPSRDLLRSIGDAYLDMWTNAAAADTIP